MLLYFIRDVLFRGGAPVQTQTADCAPLFADHDSGRRPLSFTAVKLFSFTTGPSSRYAQLWPGGGAVTVTLWLVTQDKWLTLWFCACYFFFSYQRTHFQQLERFYPESFALLCQSSSKMSLCAKSLRSYDCIFKYKHTDNKNVPISLSDGGERGKETPSYTVQRSQRWVCPLPVISPSHFLKDPSH